MTNKLCTAVDQCNALHDTLEICETFGDIVQIYIRNEGDIRRDLYEDMKAGKKEPDVHVIEMPAYPITYQPNRRQLEKAGIREDCEVLIYTPMAKWIASEVSFEEIDMTRSTVILSGIKYVIKEKGLQSQFTDIFLYITLALKRK